VTNAWWQWAYNFGGQPVALVRMIVLLVSLRNLCKEQLPNINDDEF